MTTDLLCSATAQWPARALMQWTDVSRDAIPARYVVQSSVGVTPRWLRAALRDQNCPL